MRLRRFITAAVTALALAAAPLAAHATQIFLTSGTSWTVPSDWNNASNTIECIGGGQNGAGTDGSGGQGGGYGKVTNQAASGSISIQVGTNGATATSSWWNSTATVRGKGGGSADTNVGSTTFAGGTGGSSAGGGGGAAGPNGAGGNGGGFNGSGGTGDNGSGGSGGTTGHAGGNGTEYDASHGSGGGGGGNSSGAGGAGGLYGGGGGGGFSAGSGAKGLIVVTYTPSGPPASSPHQLPTLGVGQNEYRPLPARHFAAVIDRATHAVRMVVVPTYEAELSDPAFHPPRTDQAILPLRRPIGLAEVAAIQHANDNGIPLAMAVGE